MEKFNNNDEEKGFEVYEPKEIEPLVRKPSRIQNIKIGTLNIVQKPLALAKKPLEWRKEIHGEHHKHHLILDAVLIAIIAILIGVIVNNYIFSKKELLHLVDFQVDTNTERLINGKDVTFTVNYSNSSNQILSDASLVLRIPKGLKHPTFDNMAFNPLTNSLQIGDLQPGSFGSFKVSGRLLGNIGLKEKFLAVFNYTNDLGQPRQEFFTRSFDLTESVVSTTILAPEKVIANSPFDTTVSIVNDSESVFDKVRLQMLWPDGFVYTKSSIENLPGPAEFPFGLLEQNESREITHTGRAFINSPQSISITALLYITENNEEFLLARQDVQVLVEFSKFIVQFNDIENNEFINPGKSATYKVLYKNREDFTAQNVSISVTFDGEFVDTSSLGGSNTVTLTQNNYPALALVAPGEEGIIEVNLRALRSIRFTEFPEEGVTITASATATFTIEGTDKTITVGSRPLITAVGSNVTLQNFALFYTSFGDQIGVGPLPPLVGEYTSYWAIIKIQNTANPLNNVRVTADIPAGVEFTNQHNVTAGNQLHLVDEDTIEWFIPSVQAFAGITSKAPEARIQIGIIPTVSQVGSIPSLLENIQVHAVDAKTQQEISANGPAITTAIFKDRGLNVVAQ